MKKILPFICLLFFFSRAYSQTISGTAQMCISGTRTLSGTPAGLSWSSSAPSIASVSSTGVVTGHVAGTTTITYGSSSGYATVVATVTAIAGSISGTMASCIGGTTTLYGTPSGGTWSSSTPTVATINSAGIVSGLTSGTTTISYMAPGCTSIGLLASTICCSGMPTAGLTSTNVDSACGLTTVVLTATGMTSLTSIQWQQSLDSVTWADIAPGISNPYSFTGLYVTMYYRCKVTCVASGMTSYTPGKKVRSYVCCGGGTLVAGTATASTTYCSACSLTLSSPGASSGFDIAYQWQYSPSSAGPWTNLPGGTTVPYTFSPLGTNYYRLAVTCSSSGLSTYSAPVFVAYQYRIVSESTSPPGASCLSAFGTSINGMSPLLYLKTFYGDGSHDSIATVSSGAISTVSNVHGYPYAGIYSIKKVLYYDNIPQDSAFYSYPYSCSVLPIKLFLDTAFNCIKDGGDPWNQVTVNVRVDSNSIPVDTLSVTSGLYYGALGHPGDVYSFSVLPGSVVVSCPLPGVLSDTLTAGTMVYPEKRFAVNCASASTADFAVNNVVRGTGRHMQSGHIYVRNYACMPEASTVALAFSPRYADVPTAVSPLFSVVGNVITWSVGALSFNDQIKDIHYTVNAPMAAWLIPGDTVKQDIQVIPAVVTDINPSNNVNVRTDTVKASWDPNYVAVTPPGCFDADVQQFEYTVHFENMGNDTAHNIYVLDTLSPYLDERSLEIVMASHPMDVGIYHVGGYTVAKFDFPSIKLLDSSHHGLCDGAVIYKINARTGMPVGAVAKARAGIYFDINEVVMTNEIGSTKGCPTPEVVSGVAERKPFVYPNPAKDELIVSADNAQFTSLAIVNTLGQQMVNKLISGTQTAVSVKALPAGLYQVVLHGDKGKVVLKFVKE